MDKKMNISLHEFKQFEKACHHIFKRVLEQPSMMSIERFKLSGLESSKYIYIYDHYEELKNCFIKQGL